MNILSNLRKDIPAGFVVFLVALPLCLGISLASNAPISSGLIAGIIGGTVVAFLSGSQLSISGPAAGLTAIVIAAIADLGSWQTFLAAVVLSGLIQIIFSFFGAGRFSGFFPNSVVKGLLAAIGIIIVLKQIPHALGRDFDYEGDMAFFQVTNKENTISEILLSIKTFSGPIVFITIVSLFLMIFWPKLQKKFKAVPLLQLIPAPLVAVVGGTMISESLNSFFPNFIMDPMHLVQIPATGMALLGDGFQFPGWETLTNVKVLGVAFTIAVIGSLETLLSVEAADRMDPQRRISDTNRELFAQGIGNSISGLLGGLPITSVIVRTSANVYAGATSRLASVVHGVLLLVSLFLLVPYLNKIPLAALAAVLFAIGYKLIQPQMFAAYFRKGMDQFLPFLVTVVGVVFSDILIGVSLGIVVGLAMIAKTNYHGAITVVTDRSDYLIKFTKDVSFANKVFLRRLLNSIPVGASVTIDASRAMYIDRDIYDAIQEFQEVASFKEIRLETKDLEGKQPNFRLRVKRTAREST